MLKLYLHYRTKGNIIICKNRVELLALSAAGTGSCPADENFCVAVKGSHPAAIMGESTSLFVASGYAIIFEEVFLCLN